MSKDYTNLIKREESERQVVLDSLCEFIRDIIDSNLQFKEKDGKIEMLFGDDAIDVITAIAKGNDITATNKDITISVVNMEDGVHLSACIHDWTVKLASYVFDKAEWKCVNATIYAIVHNKLRGIVRERGIEVKLDHLKSIIYATYEGIFIGYYRGETPTTEFLK